MRYSRIVGLGLSVIDHLYVVDHLRQGESRLRYSERRELSGGMMGTALAQAAQLGCDAHLLSLHGEDAAGRCVRRALRAAGVKTGRVLRAKSAVTTVAVVLVERGSGERRFLVPDRRALERRAPRFDLSLIDRRTLLLVDGHFPEQALRAVKRARRLGATVIADLNRPRPGSLALLPWVDYPIVPLEFGVAWGVGDAEILLERLRALGGGTPVVTLGARGGVYLEQGRLRRYRAQRVRVVDTTGAGDAFHGAFAAGLYHGLGLAAALALAAQAAALNCTALGGMGRLLTLAGARSLASARAPRVSARARPDRRG